VNKNLEEFIRKDIDILLEDENLTSMLADTLISFIDDDSREWETKAFYFLREARENAEKIVKENEEVGLYDR